MNASPPQHEPKLERQSPPPSIIAPMPMVPTLSGNSRKRKDHPDEADAQGQQRHVQVQFEEDEEQDAEGDEDAEGEEVDEDDAHIVNVPMPLLPSRNRDQRHSVIPNKRTSPMGDENLAESAVGSEYENGRIKCDACGTEVPFRDPVTGRFGLENWHEHKETCTSAVGSTAPRSKASQQYHHSHSHGHAHPPGPYVPPSSRHPGHYLQTNAHSNRRRSVSRSPPPQGLYSHPSQLRHGYPHHPHHARYPLAPRVSGGGERDPVILTPESAATALAHPPTKRRRAKRTEEERINYLKNDPYVAQFEAYRVLCASCDKWIRLRPNSTYCSIPWDAHRKSCLAKKISSKNTYALEERNSLFSKDPDVRKFDAERVLCGECDEWISINPEDHLQAVQKWLSHKSNCQKMLARNAYVAGQAHTSLEGPLPAQSYPSAQRSPQHSPATPRFPHPLASNASPSLPRPSLAHSLPPPREVQLPKEAIMKRRSSISCGAPLAPAPPLPHSYEDRGGRAYPSPDEDRHGRREERKPSPLQSHTQSQASESRSPTPGALARHPSPVTEGSHGSRPSPDVSARGSVPVEAGDDIRQTSTTSGASPRVSAESIDGGMSTFATTTSSLNAAQESRRRNAEQRAATLRADPLIEAVEANRVFCSLCQKWVQLRQDSSYCAYPWLQHRGKCLARHKRRLQKAEEIAEFKRRREALRTASQARRQGHIQGQSRPPSSHSSHYPPLRHLTPPDEYGYSSSELPTPVTSDDEGWDFYKNVLKGKKDRPPHGDPYHHPERSYRALPSVRPSASRPSRHPHPSSASGSGSGLYRRHQRMDEEALRVGMGSDDEMELDAEEDVDLDDVEGQFSGRPGVDEDGDVDMRGGDRRSMKGRRSGPASRAAGSRRPPSYPYSSRDRPPSPPSKRGRSNAAQVVVASAASFVPPHLADLDSPAGRKQFVYSSIAYLYQTTYESTDEMSVSTLLTYLNAAMPPDKHEDFDTAEVAKAFGASGEKGRYVLEGDLVRRV
ncbi:hypothetical protein AAF712_008083 [Marasmius tenuissimus]|uniref:Uncharacterized protein n=1 Tax=Marasmius tenuissimus TaxID=585030 RepID=A0ABR2ZUG3_9AGAR